MKEKPLVYRVHAIERMAERGIHPEDIRMVIATGEIIKAYPDDTPYPSTLMLGWVLHRPIHVVFADAPDSRIVITVYEPDRLRWNPDYRSKKP